MAVGRSEIGILYLSEHNEAVLSKLINKNDLNFEELYIAKPHVFHIKQSPSCKQRGNNNSRLNAVSVFGV